ncbi:MAG: hypothetical protein ACYC96_09155 [Fimbriimonadaceae bacterium]
MMLLSTLVLGVATSFGPGTVDDFAQSVAKDMGKNAVIVVARTAKLPKFTYDSSTADALAASVREGAHLTMAPGSDPIFSDYVYGSEHFRPLAPNLPGPPAMSSKFPDDAITNGKVTLRTSDGKPISIAGLTGAKWSRPVTVDYLMRDLAVSAAVKQMPEQEFLSAVAKAAGGFLAASDKGFKLTYDVEQLRARVINTLKVDPPMPPRQKLDVQREFYVSVVSILPQDVLQHVFSAAGEQTELNVLPNTDLSAAAIAYIKALEELNSAQAADSGAAPVLRRRGRPVIPSNILNRVDSRAIVHLRLSADGLIVLSVPIIMGRTSRYINL